MVFLRWSHKQSVLVMAWPLVQVWFGWWKSSWCCAFQSPTLLERYTSTSLYLTAMEKYQKPGILMYHIWLQILDYLLGHNDSALFRRAQLKALVSIHGKEVSPMKKTETVCKMEVMLWMSVACKFWLSEICRSYVCQTSGMMATMWKVLGCVTSGWKRRWSYTWWDYHHPRGFGPDRKGLDLTE